MSEGSGSAGPTLPEDAAAGYGRPARALFLLERDVVYLNHGGFGAAPREVLAAQDGWRARMEAQPARFMSRELPDALAAARRALAGFLGAEAADLAFVENATAGCNAVLRSCRLQPGDEVLVTDHVYPAVRNVARHVCAETGARLVEASLPAPVADPDVVTAAIAERLSAQTRLVVIDLITSATAAILPVAAIAAQARAAGARLLVDAAHGPGQIALDLPALGADWVSGNAHKWLCLGAWLFMDVQLSYCFAKLSSSAQHHCATLFIAIYWPDIGQIGIGRLQWRER